MPRTTMPVGRSVGHLASFVVQIVCIGTIFGQESINIPSQPEPEFTIANSVLRKATLDKIERIRQLRDKHQSVSGDHPDMKKVNDHFRY